MTKRGYIRLFSYAIAFTMVLAAYGIVNASAANSYKTRLENTYQQSLNELAENMDSVETNLTKSVYSDSDKMLAEISRDLYAECSQAKDALSRLPVEQMNLSSTYKFISQASDYAAYIAQKAGAGEKISDEEHQNLQKLLTYAQKLGDSVSSMASIANSGAAISTEDLQGASVKISALDTGFSGAENTFKDYPTLLYDGPFADAVLNKQSQLLKSSDKIEKDAAREIAAKAIGCNISEISYSGEEAGNMPCYVFTFSQKTVGITQRDGYVAYILYGGKITKSSISEDNAVNLAQSYLKNIGYSGMQSTYYAVNNNICVINFAYKSGSTIYYSDLVKVGVSMNNGNIVSLEAQGYLTNHTDRKNIDCKMTEKAAANKISKYLTAGECKKCVIPKDNGTEVECYEFLCNSSETGDDVLIYINADTGEEENILLLLYSDGGTLTK